MERVLAWLADGRHQIYAGVAATVIVLLLAGLIFAPSNGMVPLSKVQKLIDTSYNTGSARCVTASDGHDSCHVATEHCSGTLVVKAVDSEVFTVVRAIPPRLRSTEACANPETLTPQTSEAG